MKKMRPINLFMVLSIIAMIAFAGCTGKNEQTSNTPQNEKQNAVLIKAWAFEPATITVAKGTTVSWKNMDSASHTVVATGMVFRSGDLSNGQSFEHTFNEIGSFEYKCGIHPSKSGKVKVE